MARFNFIPGEIPSQDRHELIGEAKKNEEIVRECSREEREWILRDFHRFDMYISGVGLVSDSDAREFVRDQVSKESNSALYLDHISSEEMSDRLLLHDGIIIFTQMQIDILDFLIRLQQNRENSNLIAVLVLTR